MSFMGRKQMLFSYLVSICQRTRISFDDSKLRFVLSSCKLNQSHAVQLPRWDASVRNMSAVLCMEIVSLGKINFMPQLDDVHFYLSCLHFRCKKQSHIVINLCCIIWQYLNASITPPGTLGEKRSDFYRLFAFSWCTLVTGIHWQWWKLPVTWFHCFLWREEAEHL